MKGSMFIEPEHYLDLFSYDNWANRRVLDVIAASSPESLARAIELMSHLLRSQAVWLARVDENDEISLPIWGQDTVEECRRRADVNARDWREYLSARAAGDFNSPVTYQNTKGETFTQELREILNHVVNHGTYHRAQIALLMRGAGIAPPATDYIVYARALPKKG